MRCIFNMSNSFCSYKLQCFHLKVNFTHIVMQVFISSDSTFFPPESTHPKRRSRSSTLSVHSTADLSMTWIIFAQLCEPLSAAYNQNKLQASSYLSVEATETKHRLSERESERYKKLLFSGKAKKRRWKDGKLSHVSGSLVRAADEQTSTFFIFAVMKYVHESDALSLLAPCLQFSSWPWPLTSRPGRG